MANSSDSASLLQPPPDKFLYRMLAAVNCGILLLIWGYGLNMQFQRLPNLERVIQNTRLESIGRSGEWLIDKKWILTFVPVVSLGFCTFAVRRPRRGFVATSFVFTFVAIAVALAAEVADARIWTRVLGKVLQ